MSQNPAKFFRTPTEKDPFEVLQKWTIWLFALNPLLAALAFGTGSLAVDPKGLAAGFPAMSVLLFGISLAMTAVAYCLAVGEVQPTEQSGLYEEAGICAPEFDPVRALICAKILGPNSLRFQVGQWRPIAHA
jgi:hypothetical protein